MIETHEISDIIVLGDPFPCDDFSKQALDLIWVSSLLSYELIAHFVDLFLFVFPESTHHNFYGDLKGDLVQKCSSDRPQ